MKRRRQTLQVSTFPFLAVLLCAMGSLILLLLVIDRRAKVVMRAKALAAIRQMEAEDAKDSTARTAEWEQRRRALHEQLQQQNQELDAKSASLERQLADVANEIKTKQSQLLVLDKQLKTEKENLIRGEKAVASGVQEAQQKKAQSEATAAELTRLSTELIKLEQTLEDLKTLRKRQQQTYSLVPYRGHRGDNRRPLYLECDASSLVFHPDRLVLPATDSSGSAILHEVERRISLQQPNSESSKAETPYLLLLVRPDGIVTYYRVLAALRSLKVDFGYEFVQSDWVLDFPQDGKATQPWMAAGPAPPLSGEREPPESARKNPQTSIGSEGPKGRESDGSSRPPLGLSGASGNAIVGRQGNGTSSEMGEQDEDAPPQLKGWRGFPGNGNFRSQRHLASLPGDTRDDLSATPGGVATDGQGGQGGTFPAGRQGIFPAGSAISGGSPERSAVTLGTARPRGVSFAGTSGSGGTTASDDQGRNGPIGNGGTSEQGASSHRFPPSPPGEGTPFSRDPIAERAPSSPPLSSRSQTGLWEQGLGGTKMEGNENERGSGNVGPDTNARPAEDSNPIFGKSASPNGGAPNGSSPANATGTQSAPSLIPTFGTPPSEGSGRSGNPSAGADRAQASEPEDAGPRLGSSSGLGQLGATHEKKPEPPAVVHRYVRRDWNIFVECAADHVIVYPGGLRIAANSLGGHGNGQNPSLVEAIQQMIARRQAVIGSSEPTKDGPPPPPQIRFLLRPDGLRTYFLAYPQLEPLHLPMTRENLDAEEDVVRHMMGR